MDWARVRGYCSGENPARWRGHLDNLLPKRSKVQKVKHQPALPYAQIGDFMTALQTQEKVMASLALQFTILTACRTSEAISATWDEINFSSKIWIIPETRIKMEKEHRVPLSNAALNVLKQAKEQNKNDGSNWVFSGFKKSKHLSNMAMLNLLDRMGRKGITVHGFRSTFRDWAAEQTNFPREVTEAALAHATRCYLSSSGRIPY